MIFNAQLSSDFILTAERAIEPPPRNADTKKQCQCKITVPASI